jgi:hypothetical protein
MLMGPAGLLKGAIAGFVFTTADYVSDWITEQSSSEAYGDIASWTVQGIALGTMFGPTGALVGGILGFLAGTYKEVVAWLDKQQQQVSAKLQQQLAGYDFDQFSDQFRKMELERKNSTESTARAFLSAPEARSHLLPETRAKITELFERSVGVAHVIGEEIPTQDRAIELLEEAKDVKEELVTISKDRHLTSTQREQIETIINNMESSIESFRAAKQALSPDNIARDLDVMDLTDDRLGASPEVRHLIAQRVRTSYTPEEVRADQEHRALMSSSEPLTYPMESASQTSHAGRTVYHEGLLETIREMTNIKNMSSPQSITPVIAPTTVNANRSNNFYSPLRPEFRGTIPGSEFRVR